MLGQVGALSPETPCLHHPAARSFAPARGLTAAGQRPALHEAQSPSYLSSLTRRMMLAKLPFSRVPTRYECPWIPATIGLATLVLPTSLAPAAVSQDSSVGMTGQQLLTQCQVVIFARLLPPPCCPSWPHFWRGRAELKQPALLPWMRFMVHRLLAEHAREMPWSTLLQRAS